MAYHKYLFLHVCVHEMCHVLTAESINFISLHFISFFLAMYKFVIEEPCKKVKSPSHCVEEFGFGFKNK